MNRIQLLTRTCSSLTMRDVMITAEMIKRCEEIAAIKRPYMTHDEIVAWATRLVGDVKDARD